MKTKNIVMKQIGLFILGVFFIFTSCSYEAGVSEAFTKYRFKDGVTTVTVPGWVIHLAANFGDLDETEQEILESIDKVRVLAIEDNNLNAKTNLHEEFYNRINKNNYEELLVVREADESVTIFGEMENNVIKEMIVLVGGDDNALIYIKGEIRPELLNDKINITNPDKFLSFDF